MNNNPQSVLKVENLNTSYFTPQGRFDAVREATFEIKERQTFALVGESGSGKTTLSLSILNYLGLQGRIRSGRILFYGENLLDKSADDLRKIWGARIGVIYQDPQASLNPSIIVGKQIAEVLRRHRSLSKGESWSKTIELLDRVHLPDPEIIARRYPHQLSGGMQQRVVIAMAISCDPDLLIMDEPTTALDVTMEARVLDLIDELKEQSNSAILYITHNLGVVARVADQVGVMYAGQIVETGSVEEVFYRPKHPYTVGLLNSVLDPRVRYTGELPYIKGRVPPLNQLPPGCIYEPRCSMRRPECKEIRPDLREIQPRHYTACLFGEEVQKHELSEPIQLFESVEAGLEAKEALFEVRQLKKYYGRHHKQFILFGAAHDLRVKAVNNISFQTAKREIVSIVGESGCGKTTLARCIVGLLEPTAGELILNEVNINALAARRPIEVRRSLQIVFQNPDATLNPAHTVGYTLGRSLQSLGLVDKDEVNHQVNRLLESVNLDASYAKRYPSQLSGGEKQRVAIARAFAAEPELVVCDEPTSALDVSVRASILNLLLNLQQKTGASYLYISHDLSVVRHISDRILVVYLGKIVEVGSSEQLFSPPYHPYTEALLSAIPIPDPQAQQTRIRLEGAVPSPINPPQGCVFHTRCPRKIGKICEELPPPYRLTGRGHYINCHLSLEELCQTELETFSEPKKDVISNF